MNNQHTERRAARRTGAHGGEFDADTVRQGLALQRQSNTSSAVEYLKARDVGAAVINRVLSGQALRSEDQAQLAHSPAAPQL